MTAYDQDLMEDIRRSLQNAESEAYSALSGAQETDNVKLENMLDEVHNLILRALEQL
jgi:hypothetical protein